MGPSLGEALRAAAEALGLRLSDLQAGQLLDFVALLDRWNRTYNLTAVRDPADMLTQHVIDCLAAVPALRRTSPGPKRLVDVGSGGGLPGVVWAVVEPELHVTCVDSVGKKTAFIQQAALALRLDNLRAEHARIEHLRATRFDVVTSRAFASLADFVRLTHELSTPGGVWLAMKGKLPLDEIAALPPGFQAFHVERLTVPGLEAERCLIWIRKMAPRLGTSESGRLQ
ncbi:MAG: 16S rRNA (guanine(527)-N(7))-methyltransferase RsmG [Caldimonas sp.]